MPSKCSPAAAAWAPLTSAARPSWGVGPAVLSGRVPAAAALNRRLASTARRPWILENVSQWVVLAGVGYLVVRGRFGSAVPQARPWLA